MVTSSFSDSIVFAVHTRKKRRFSNSTVFKSFHCGERFRNDPFSDRCSLDGSRLNSVFNTDARCSVDGRKRYENDTKTISVDGNRFENGAKQYRFHLKTV